LRGPIRKSRTWRSAARVYKLNNKEQIRWKKKRKKTPHCSRSPPNPNIMKSCTNPHLPFLSIHKLPFCRTSLWAHSLVLTARGAQLTINCSLAPGGWDSKALVKWVVAGKMAILYHTPEDMPTRGVSDFFVSAHCFLGCIVLCECCVSVV
jgi:hypothetical protein